LEKIALEMPKNHKMSACPESIEDLWDGLKSLPKCLERLKAENADLRVQLERAKERP
jgi:predicted RNase H-like nuclease (RuvC/YqgF family)